MDKILIVINNGVVTSIIKNFQPEVEAIIVDLDNRQVGEEYIERVDVPTNLDPYIEEYINSLEIQEA